MIQQLNGLLAKPVGFPQIPDPRKDCHLSQANPGERHQQYVLCPEQDCEWLVYMSDQNTSMIEALDVQDHPLWKQRMQDYHDWQQKINKGSKTSKEVMDLARRHFIQVVYHFYQGIFQAWPICSC